MFDTRAPLERPIKNSTIKKKGATRCRTFPRQYPSSSNAESIVKEKRGIVIIAEKVWTEKRPFIFPLIIRDHRVNPPMTQTRSAMKYRHLSKALEDLSTKAARRTQKANSITSDQPLPQEKKESALKAVIIAPQINRKDKEIFTKRGNDLKKDANSDFLDTEPIRAIKKPRYLGIGPITPNSKANRNPASTRLSGNKN